MIDHFHKRLSSIEDGLKRNIAAPTFPIYDPANLPQDAVQGQIALGTDNSFMWFDETWHTQVAGTATIGSVPQDAVEGQVVVATDHGLAWYVNGSWRGMGGSVVTGNPPQDAITGQLALGNGIMCWHHDGTWYTFGGAVGQVLRLMTSNAKNNAGFNLDDYTPALYYMFPAPQTDVWLQVNWRHDLSGGFSYWQFLTLGFTEWVNDQAYYGDWWRTGGFWATNEYNGFRAWFGENNFSSYSYSGNDYGAAPTNPTTAVIYDFHAQYLGDVTSGGITRSQWFTEAYRDGVKRTDSTWVISHDPGKPNFHSIQALSINNLYSWTGAAYIYIDDIKIGTTQGGSDILSENFDSGPWGQFTLDLGDLTVMRESFDLVADPAI